MLTYMPICLHFKSTSYSRLLSIFKALEYHVMSLPVLFCQKYVRHHYHVFLFCAPTCPIYVLQHLKASECIKSPPRSPFLHSYSRHFYAITPVPRIEHESMMSRGFLSLQKYTTLTLMLPASASLEFTSITIFEMSQVQTHLAPSLLLPRYLPFRNVITNGIKPFPCVSPPSFRKPVDPDRHDSCVPTCHESRLC